MLTRRALLAATLPLVACGASLAPSALAALPALAAASLQEVLPALAAARARRAIAPAFGGTSRLAKQLEAGAPAALFFSADDAWMRWAEERGLVTAAVRVARNQLVVAVRAAPGGAPQVASLAALEAVERVALAGEEVPAGRYAREALASAGVALGARALVAEDVRAALAWVARGEADAALVYATDVRAEPKTTAALTVDPSLHSPIHVLGAVTTQATSAPQNDNQQDPRDAAAFLAFCTGAEGRAIWASHGFLAA